MADLTENSGRKFHGPVRYVTFDVGANLEVFAGQAMIAGTNGIVNLTTGGEFVGFADEHVDNRTNVEPHEGVARATTAKLAVEGMVWLTIDKGSAIASTDVGAAVYANDGNTFDLADAGSDVAIGKIVQCDDATGSNSGECLVAFGLAYI